jgi:hypothetical protein
MPAPITPILGLVTPEVQVREAFGTSSAIHDLARSAPAGDLTSGWHSVGEVAETRVKSGHSPLVSK